MGVCEMMSMLPLTRGHGKGRGQRENQAGCSAAEHDCRSWTQNASHTARLVRPCQQHTLQRPGLTAPALYPGRHTHISALSRGFPLPSHSHSPGSIAGDEPHGCLQEGLLVLCVPEHSVAAQLHHAAHGPQGRPILGLAAASRRPAEDKTIIQVMHSITDRQLRKAAQACMTACQARLSSAHSQAKECNHCLQPLCNPCSWLNAVVSFFLLSSKSTLPRAHRHTRLALSIIQLAQ